MKLRTGQSPPNPVMPPLNLREYETSEVTLSADELTALLQHQKALDLRIEPRDENHWRLTPGSTVGALEIGDVLSVSIQPKLDIRRVLFLASYALGEFQLRDLESFLYPEKDPPLETMARFFTDAAQRAFARGLLHGYRTEEEALLTVRGRIRFDEQIRRRFGVPLPVEVRYDDFTDDVLANRLVKAAALALGAMRLKDPTSRTQVGRVAGHPRKRHFRLLRAAEHPRGDFRPAERALPARRRLVAPHPATTRPSKPVVARFAPQDS